MLGPAGAHSVRPDAAAANCTSTSTTTATLPTGADAQNRLLTPAWQRDTGPTAASCCIFRH